MIQITKRKKEIKINLNLTNIITQIPLILEYFIYGYIFLKLFQFFTTKKIDSQFIILCVLISFIIKSLLNVVLSMFNIELGIYPIALLGCLLSAVIALIVVVTYNHRLINKICNKIGYKLIDNDIWKSIIDFKLGTNAHLFCGENVYVGTIIAIEENGLDSWIVLGNYDIRDNNNTCLKEKSDELSLMTVNLRTV